MRKFVVNVVLFFAIITILDFSFGFVCDKMVKHTQSGDYARVLGILKKNKYSVMLMGSSRCVCHYDDKLMTEILNADVINAGEKGNGIVLMYGRYHIIPKEQKPHVLLYDIEPAFDIIDYENDDKDKRYLAGLKVFFDEPGIREIFKKVDVVEPIKMQSHLYRYNSELFAITRDYVKKGKTNMSCYNPSYKTYAPPSETNNEISIRNDHLKLYYIEQLIKETQNDGVRLVFVASPKYSAKSSDILQPVMKLCEEYRVPFWNYYLGMHDTKWFCNDMHLNYGGSQEFTKTIIQKIKDERLIK